MFARTHTHLAEPSLPLDEALRERVEPAVRYSASASAFSWRSRRSEEDGGVEGLGLLPGRAVRLREGRVPRIGWADVDPAGVAFYFAHSFAAETPLCDRDVGRNRRRRASAGVHRRAVPS